MIERNPGLMQADLARSLSYGIFLSKAGEALLKELKQIASDSDREATAALDDEERGQLLRLLTKIYQD